MTREDWRKYGKYHDDTTRCPYCGKLITKNEEGVTYAKTAEALTSSHTTSVWKEGSDD